MSDAYYELLDATIQHLEQLKARGVRFVPVSPQVLAGLSRSRPPTSPGPAVPPVAAPAAAPRPAPAGTRLPTSAAPPAQPDFSGLGLLTQTPAVAEPAAPTASPNVLTGQAKIAAFNALRERALQCVKCPHLAAARKTVVFGVGSIDAELMFVGEAPGADEDEQGEPFVGRAGQLLTRIIQTMGLSRESVYIANILKCRPDTPGQSAGNRKPTPQEMATCIPYLHEQIDLIRPKVLVALGGTAVEGLLGASVGITRCRGQWRVYRGIPLMPTFHPSYLLRNQGLSSKRQTWEDMLQVMEKLGLPISEKQRNYFLKGAG